MSEIYKNVLACAICKQLNASKCTRCHTIAYCSKEHQKADWKRHKQFCHMHHDDEKKLNTSENLFTKYQTKYPSMWQEALTKINVGERSKIYLLRPTVVETTTLEEIKSKIDPQSYKYLESTYNGKSEDQCIVIVFGEMGDIFIQRFSIARPIEPTMNSNISSNKYVTLDDNKRAVLADAFFKSEWFLQHPQVVQDAFKKMPPWKFYRVKSSGNPCRVIGFHETLGELRAQTIVPLVPIFNRTIGGHPIENIESVDNWTEEDISALMLFSEKNRKTFLTDVGFTNFVDGDD